MVTNSLVLYIACIKPPLALKDEYILRFAIFSALALNKIWVVGETIRLT